MTVANKYDTYLTSHYEGMDPKQLILMLYDGALKHIRLARSGIEQKNIQMRGEHLGRAIAIIAELNACLDTKINDEAVAFLRGLYAAILAELPKVSINNDINILNQTDTYIGELRKIWVSTVLKAKPTDSAQLNIVAAANGQPQEPTPAKIERRLNPYGNGGAAAYGFKSISI